MQRLPVADEFIPPGVWAESRVTGQLWISFYKRFSSFFFFHAEDIIFRLSCSELEELFCQTIIVFNSIVSLVIINCEDTIVLTDEGNDHIFQMQINVFSHHIYTVPFQQHHWKWLIIYAYVDLHHTSFDNNCGSCGRIHHYSYFLHTSH